MPAVNESRAMSHQARSRRAMSLPIGCLRSSCSDSFDVLNEPKNWQRLMPATSSLNGPTRRSRSAGLVALDVHDGGAVVGQRLGRDRPDADPREVGHLDALQREALPNRGGQPAPRDRRRRSPRCRPCRVQPVEAPRPCARRRRAPDASTADGRRRRLHERPRRRAASGRSAAAPRPSSRAPPAARAVSTSATVFTGASVTPRAMPPSNSSDLRCLQRELGDGVAHLRERVRELRRR